MFIVYCFIVYHLFVCLFVCLFYLFIGYKDQYMTIRFKVIKSTTFTIHIINIYIVVTQLILFSKLFFCRREIKGKTTVLIERRYFGGTVRELFISYCKFIYYYTK